MEQRPFGTTGLDVSAVGYGCWEVGGGYGDVEVEDFERAVARSLDLGVNCFDTAEGYGMGASERALAQALGRRRDEAVIVTKFGMNYRDMPNLRDSSRARVSASIDKSLKNLGTDYVDVYLVHWPDRNTPFEFQIDRRPNPHLAFGFGEHFCIGAHLARVEIEAVFRHLLARLDAFELAGAVVRLESAVNGSIKRLPLRYTLTKQ